MFDMTKQNVEEEMDGANITDLVVKLEVTQEDDPPDRDSEEEEQLRAKEEGTECKFNSQPQLKAKQDEEEDVRSADIQPPLQLPAQDPEVQKGN